MLPNPEALVPVTDSKEPQEAGRPVEAITVEISRGKSVRKGHISALHQWWARRPNALARVAGYLAITEEQDPEPDFLAALGVLDPSASTLNEARSKVRDTCWRWCVRENLLRDVDLLSVTCISPSLPKILDPFAGGGSIPMEASRLGCHAYAGDLNRLAYRILRVTIEYPAKLVEADATPPVTGGKGKWHGLINELRHWTTAVDRRVSAKIRDLYPPDPVTRGALDRYFWFLFIRCSSPTCGVEYPAQPSLRLARGPAVTSVVFIWTGRGPTAKIVSDDQPGQARGIYSCPVCGVQRHADSIAPDELLWKLCLARRETAKTFIEVGPESQEAFAPWSDQHQAQLRAFLARPETQPLRSEVSELYRHLRKKGVTTFQDLFTPRQLLVAAAYVYAIGEVIDEMRLAGLEAYRIEALSSYLSLFLGYLVNRNSRLCAWNPERAEADVSFSRMTPVLPLVFVERLPRGLMEAWLITIIPAIEAASIVPPASAVFCGSAMQLPFEDDFFDAIVTDPPYYDAVPYSHLAEFFWIWESMIPCDPVPPSNESVSRARELLHSKVGQPGAAAYRQSMLAAFREIWRVLKPGRKFCLIFSGKATHSFQDYVDLCQQAGLELVDVKRVPERILGARNSAESVTYLIYLRKPSRQSIREPLQAAEASSLLKAAASGKPVLYAGLAELITKRLSASDLKDILPIGGKGSAVEQLMEVLADEDPREILMKCFGIGGLRQLANELCPDGSEQLLASPIETVLAYFGFSLSCTALPDGAPQVGKKLRQIRAKIAQAREKGEMRGPFLEAVTAIERLLRLSIWGWAQLIFGANRDRQLLSILESESKDRRFDLNRLTMGDILVLLRGLPNAIAVSPKADVIQRKFGRRYIYSNKKTPFIELLSSLINYRNKIEHDKDGYWTNIDVGPARTDFLKTLSDAEKLLLTLVDTRAIPAIAEPIKEIRDKWNRRTYILAVDDGTERQAHFSSTLTLGQCYLYFGTETNPRPVDPLVLPLDEVGRIA